MAKRKNTNLTLIKKDNSKQVVANITKPVISPAVTSSLSSGRGTSSKVASNSSTKYLIDEIIHIDIVSSSIASIPFVHRTFAMFGAIAEAKVNLDITNYADYTTGLTDVTLAGYINLWFNLGGQALTIYQTPNEPTPPDEGGEVTTEVTGLTIPAIAEGNVILGNLDLTTQLSLYNAFSATDKANLTFFFSVSANDEISSITPARNINFILIDSIDDSKNYVFEYLAPYTQARYYRRNNFEPSTLAGIKVTSLDLLTANNFGSLVYFPSFKESKYYNIVDASGYLLNWDFLKLDLKHDIQQKMLTLLSSRNYYDQADICRLETSMKTVCKYYMDNNLIYPIIKTSSVPLIKQNQEEVIAGIIRGFKLQYIPKAEIKQVYVTEKEVLSI